MLFLCFLVNEFMNIYHGSKQVVDHPTLGGSNPHNDYGPSFYMTTDLNQAKSLKSPIFAHRFDID